MVFVLDAVRHWAACLCYGAVAAGLTLLLVPSSGLQRLMKLAVAVFFLGVITAPFSQVGPTLTWAGSQGWEDRSRQVEEQVELHSQQTAFSIAQQNLQGIVQQMLGQAGIKVEASHINITITAASPENPQSPQVEARVSLRAQQQSQAKQAEQLLRQAGLSPTVELLPAEG